MVERLVEKKKLKHSLQENENNFIVQPFVLVFLLSFLNKNICSTNPFIHLFVLNVSMDLVATIYTNYT